MSLVLNRRMRLDTRQRTRDDAGGYVETWVPLGELWAHLKAGTGREGEVEGLNIASGTYKITVRAAPESAPSRPKPGQRLVEGNRVYRILAVTDQSTHSRYLICHAREEEVAA